MTSQNLIKHHTETLGGYTIDGLWYEGHRAWRVLLISHGTQELYWVSGNEFRFADVDVERSGNRIRAEGLATDLDSTLRQGVLDRIKTWEKENEDAAADDLF